MNNAIKGAMAAGLVALGFSVSGCNSSSANAAAEKSPDPAEAAAAALDKEMAQPAPPAEMAPEKK